MKKSFIKKNKTKKKRQNYSLNNQMRLDNFLSLCIDTRSETK
jgi:hypothetical protein